MAKKIKERKQIYYFFNKGLYDFKSSAELTEEEAGELCDSNDVDYYISEGEIKHLIENFNNNKIC